MRMQSSPETGTGHVDDDTEETVDNTPDSVASNESLEEEIADLRSEMVELRNLLEEERAQQREPVTRNDSFSLQDLPIPTPGDIVHFTNEYTIPAIIKLLELNIKLLKGLQMGLRVVDPHYERGDGISSDSTVGGAMDKLRSGLSDVETDDSALNRRVNSVREKIDDVLIDPEETTGTIETEEPVETVDETEESETERAINSMRETIESAETMTANSRTRDDDTIDEVSDDESDDTSDESNEEPEHSSVDVESELASIKREVENEQSNE